MQDTYGNDISSTGTQYTFNTATGELQITSFLTDSTVSGYFSQTVKIKVNADYKTGVSSIKSA